MSIIPGWPLHPIEDRIRALRYDGGENWSLCDYTDLRPGDIFKPVNPEGLDVHPFEHRLDDRNVCVVKGEPQPALDQHDGYAIDVDLVFTLDAALARSPRANPPRTT